MDERTLTALKGSIAKWEAIVAGTGEDLGSDNCPLCAEFAEVDDDYSACQGCPVYERTKRRGCGGTPYDDWSRACWLADLPRRAETPVLKAAAQAELDFLRSLLPAEGTA